MRFKRHQGQVASQQHGQPCKIDCGHHSLVGGGGSQPEHSMLVTSLGGTKVWMFVFLKHKWTERRKCCWPTGWVGNPWSSQVASAVPHDGPLLLRKWLVVERKKKTNPRNGDLCLEKPAFHSELGQTHVAPSSLVFCLLYEDCIPLEIFYSLILSVIKNIIMLSKWYLTLL